MTMPPVIAKPLNAIDFAPFGEVISTINAPTQLDINYGNTIRFHDLASIDFTAKGGRPGISIFRAKPLPQPIKIAVMERHPLSSQAFYPLQAHAFLVVVAPLGDFVAANICAFIARPDQGVNYRAGVWHHYLLALEAQSDFLVVDRIGGGDNCDEIHMDDGPQIMLENPS